MVDPHHLARRLGLLDDGPSPSDAVGAEVGLVSRTIEVDGEMAPIRVRVRDVATRLRNDLGRLVLALGGPSPRLRELVDSTHLDKTLVGRVMKASRASEPMEALEEIPSPQGLRMFVRAAALCGVPVEAVERAGATVDRFEALLREFGGRSEFDTALSGWVPAAWDRRERAARQAAFRASSFLIGCRADAIVGAHVVQPSADGEACDVIRVRGRYGLRRLREGTPLIVFGTRPYAPGGECVYETVDGTPEPGDPEAFLLEGYCSQPVPSMRWLERGDDRLLVLERDAPGVNEPVTLCLGVIARGMWRRYRSDGIDEERHAGIPRMPARVLCEDLILHEDVYPGVEPVVETRLHGFSAAQRRETGELADLDRIDVSVETSWIGMDDLATGEAPGYPEMIDEVFERSGWDRSRFRVFRQRISYPVPFVSLTTWFALRDRPA
jgi:hypothetical protein